MPKWLFYKELSAIEPLQLVAATIGHKDVVFVREGDAVVCFLDQCTHQPLMLSEFGDFSEGKIRCHAHGAKFCGRFGEVLEGPAEDCLTRYQVKVEKGNVFVCLQDS